MINEEAVKHWADEFNHTVERLREWGESLEREHKGGLGASLLEYAEAWKKRLAERDAALARCVEALAAIASGKIDPANIIAFARISMITINTSVQATAKVLAAARRLGERLDGYPISELEAAETALIDAISEEQEYRSSETS